LQSSGFVSECLSVRLHISKTTCQTSRNFLYMLIVATAWHFTDTVQHIMNSQFCE